jgi:hypothetical protein
MWHDGEAAETAQAQTDEEPLLSSGEETRAFLMLTACEKHVAFGVIGNAIFAGWTKSEIEDCDPEKLLRYFGSKAGRDNPPVVAMDRAVKPEPIRMGSNRQHGVRHS